MGQASHHPQEHVACHLLRNEVPKSLPTHPEPRLGSQVIAERTGHLLVSQLRRTPPTFLKQSPFSYRRALTLYIEGQEVLGKTMIILNLPLGIFLLASSTCPSPCKSCQEMGLLAHTGPPHLEPSTRTLNAPLGCPLNVHPSTSQKQYAFRACPLPRRLPSH